MINYNWIGSPDTSDLDANGNPSWIVHLYNRAEAEIFKPCEDGEAIGYVYKSCCGRVSITTDTPPSEPDTDFIAEPPAPGIKNEELYCKDCIKIWEKMQSH